LLDLGQGQTQSGDDRDPLAGPALGLPADPHGGGPRDPRGILWAYAVLNRTPAVGAQLTQARGIDYSGILETHRNRNDTQQ
jgi:hypothetical protein